MIVEQLSLWVTIFAGLVTIFGGGIGIYGYFRYRIQKRQQLIAYLKERKKVAPKEGKVGRHSAAHLTRRFGFTSAQLYAMAKKNKHIGYDDNTDTFKVWYYYTDEKSK